jgi:hypothetical protein
LGINSPDPRKQLITDLQTQIMSFNKNNESSIICIDANDGLFNRSSLIPTFLSNTNLVPLICNPEEYPPTHTRGSQCIDFIFGSPNVLQHIVSSGMTSFFSSPWPHTDHRGLFVDIDIVGLLGATLHDIPKPVPRKVTSKSKKIINTFVTNIHNSNQTPNILHQLLLLQKIDQWTSKEYSTLETLDQQFTSVLLNSEKLSSIPTTNHWSPELHTKSQIYKYWLLYLKGKKNNINVDVQLDEILSTTPLNTILQDNPNRHFIKQLQHARKSLIDVRTNSYHHRQVFLNHLQSHRIESGHVNEAHIIRQIK